jgi:DNA-binding NtrC family response regulator
MEHLRRRIEAVAGRLCTVLIDGESGTGKEVVAREIHVRSARRVAPLVAVDCTVCSETLFESQLFGHEKGAFTGAEHATLGFFRAANRGTLFLDEIGELTPSAQAKLLRCIQQREVVPVGCVEPVPVDVRIIAATHQDLAELVRQGRFREDLYFRINVACLSVPPLRERGGDIRCLAEHYLRELAQLYHEPIKTLSDEAAAVLQSYHWPGNVRELQNAMEVADTFCEEQVVNPSVLPQVVRAAARNAPASDEATISPLESAERSLIASTLRETGGNQSQAAVRLRIERHRLHRKIVRYGLQSLTRSAPR